MRWGPPGAKQRNGEIVSYAVTYGSCDENGNSVGNVKAVTINDDLLNKASDDEIRNKVRHFVLKAYLRLDTRKSLLDMGQ